MDNKEVYVLGRGYFMTYSNLSIGRPQFPS